MKAVKQSLHNLMDDLVSLTKICGAVMVVGIALGGFRYASSGALSIFY